MDEQPPTKAERHLVYRCLLTRHGLIGDEDDMWASPFAPPVLKALRTCVRAILNLIENREGVYASSIKMRVTSWWGTSAVGGLDEMADFLVDDREAREYWQGLQPDSRYPHTCPLCGRSPAYVGFLTVECRSKCASSSSRL